MHKLSRALGALSLVTAVAAVTPMPAHAASLPVVGFQLPQVKHVWTIVLENSDEVQTIAGDETQGMGELTTTLTTQGALLTNYFATGHSSLDNYVSLVSGQGPNPETQGDCTGDDPVGGSRTTAIPGADGQAMGTPAAIAAGQPGCVYPANVPTLANQLTNAGYTWRTYAQGEDLYPQTRRTTCASAKYRPLLNGTGANSTYADNYAPKHDPFLYFLGVTGDGATPNPLCDSGEVGLDRLQSDLASDATTPNWSLIVPDLCNDAHDSSGCKTNSAGPDSASPAATYGVPQADDFLRAYVPMILSSAAFKDAGLLLITFDEGKEALACCGEVTSPNLPTGQDNGGSTVPGGIYDRGGGQIGLVAISPFITPGTVSAVPYDHYSYLRTMEDLFRLTPARTGIPGSDGLGHLGYAGSQGGSTAAAPASFGADVFTNPSATTVTPALPEVRLAVLLPVAALLAAAAYATRKLRRAA